ncbi:MAG TPA: hypothetical protein VK348_12520 [Planctomycetota bacterium]|nr:hypothetical protein [Planctomycetota bacterium]
MIRPGLLAAMISLQLQGQVHGQEPGAAAATALPPPIVHFETVGPAGWVTQILPTTLGGLLESEAGRKVWQPAVQPLQQAWRQSFPDDAQGNGQSRRLLDYSGRIQLFVWSDSPAAGGQKAVLAALVLDGDGTTDLAALAADLQQVLERLSPGITFQERDVIGQRLQVLDGGNGARITAPQRDGNRLLVAFAQGGDLGAAFGRARAVPAPAAGGRARPLAPVCSIHVDLAQVVAASLAGAEKADADRLVALGLDSLGSLGFQVQAAGPHVMFELSQTFTGRARGLFGGLFPEAAGLPSLLALVQKDAVAWKVGRVDLAAIAGSVLAAVAAGSGEQLVEVRARQRQDLGIDLVDDLLAHTSGEALVLGPTPAALEGHAGGEAPGFVLALGLKDEAAFRRSFATLMQRSARWLRCMAATDHDGVMISRYSGVFPGDTWVAIGRGIVVLAGGAAAEAGIAAVLDAQKQPVTGAPALPPEFDALRPFATPGASGAAVVDLPALLLLQARGAFALLEPMLPDPLAGFDFRDADGDGVPDAVQELMPLLQRHQLDRVRAFSGCAAGRWALRLLW